MTRSLRKTPNGKIVHLASLQAHQGPFQTTIHIKIATARPSYKTPPQNAYLIRSASFSDPHPPPPADRPSKLIRPKHQTINYQHPNLGRAIYRRRQMESSPWACTLGQSHAHGTIPVDSAAPSQEPSPATRNWKERRDAYAAVPASLLAWRDEIPGHVLYFPIRPAGIGRGEMSQPGTQRNHGSILQMRGRLITSKTAEQVGSTPRADRRRSRPRRGPRVPGL
jgi:hypothetical protein